MGVLPIANKINQFVGKRSSGVDLTRFFVVLRTFRKTRRAI